MDPALGENAKLCPNCSAQSSGRFCSSCGYEIATAAHRTGWRGVAADIADASDNVGIAKTFWTVARSPVGGVIKLALDPRYSGHLKFFVAAVGIAATVVFILLPKLVLPIVGEAPQNTQSNAAVFAVLEYTFFVIWMVATYYAFNTIADTKREPNQYFKACTLGVSFNLLVTAFFASLAVAVLITLGRDADQEDAVTVLQATDVVVRAGLLIYNVTLQTRFWKLAWYWPAGVLAAQMAINAIAVPVVAGLTRGWNIPNLF